MLDLDEIFDAVNEAMSPAESARLRRLMKRAVVDFKFKKKSDGTVRKARGTLRQDMLPKYADKRRAKPSKTVFRYWDVDKGSFRSFLKDNFIEIDGVEKEDRAEKPAGEDPGAE